MNKRQKKKRAIESQMAFLMAENALLTDAVKRLNQRVTSSETRIDGIDLRSGMIEDSLELLNKEFTTYKAEQKDLLEKQDMEISTLSSQVGELKLNVKKSWWKRK